MEYLLRSDSRTSVLRSEWTLKTVATFRHTRGVNGIAEIVSLCTMVIATVVTLFLLNQGQRDRRALTREAKREQARHVSAWADWQHLGDLATFGKPHLPAVFIRNSSSAAVYDVFVDYRAPIDGAATRVAIGPVPPGETRIRQIDYDGKLESNWEPAALFPRVNFRDSTGQRWLRDAMGRLRPDPGPRHDKFFDEGGVVL